MKKIISIVFLAFLISSCGPGKVARESRATLNGDWLLHSISYTGSEADLEVTLFNDSQAGCFEGSEWNFVSNNNTGSYAPVKPMCGTQPRFFKWSIAEVNTAAGNYDFLLKPTDAGFDSPDDQGFRIDLSNLSEDMMVWEQTLTFEGKPFIIQMNFIKQQ